MNSSEDKIAAAIEHVGTVLAFIAGILLSMNSAHCAPLVSDGDEIASVGTTQGVRR